MKQTEMSEILDKWIEAFRKYEKHRKITLGECITTNVPLVGEDWEELWGEEWS